MLSATGGRAPESQSAAGGAAPPQQLGQHHFAYLRAVAEGLQPATAAARYLALGHASQLPSIHRALVAQAQAVARRRSDSRWRLIGIEFPPAPPPAALPSLHEWAEREGLGDWSHQELLDLYNEKLAVTEDDQARRRRRRDERLRARRIELLRDLERAAAQCARPTDLVDGWLERDLADHLSRLGVLTLADLASRIRRGGRWWLGIPAYGPAKAKRLAQLVVTLLGPGATQPQWAQIAQTVAVASASTQGLRFAESLSGINGANRAPRPTPNHPQHATDLAAVRAWVKARTHSTNTERYYTREIERFMLWAAIERGRALSDVSTDDCRAYIDFLADIPERWIGRNKAPRHAAGWAPFRDQLTVASRKSAIVAVAACFGWLLKTAYLAIDPWQMVNHALGDDPRVHRGSTSKAFTPAAWAALTAAARGGDGPAAHRMRWLLAFTEATGLRPSEVIAARRGHLRELPAGWVIDVHGKGDRNRTVPVPSIAVAATRVYFATRGLEFNWMPASRGDDGPPLLAQLDDGGRPIGYQALHKSLKRFIAAALRNSSLPAHECEVALRASSHWLRHTYATRAVEREVPADILQANLGHRDPQTTAIYFQAQLERRQRAMERAFGQDEPIGPGRQGAAA